MTRLDQLTIGATLLFSVLLIAGVHTYASGRAQRAALEQRLSSTQQITTAGRRRRFRGVDRRLKQTGFGKKIELRLAATGLDLTPGEFFVYMVAAVAGFWLLASSVLASFFGPIAGLIALWSAFAFLNWQRQKRIEKFINQLPELSRIIANATQAGLALRMAISLAAEELEEPAGDELAKVANALAIGHSIDEALGELADRLPSRELVVLVTTLVLSNRSGGAIVSSLRNLTETLEERKETRREVRTQLSQVTLTAYIVPGMGLAMLMFMDSVWDGALDKITGNTLGQAVVLLALGLYLVGFFLVRRLAKIEV
ncbi:type II secretion system F family protein [Streptomyces lunaelactis]|uniref:type II secretion system F family protein n=1 Tax=Streptomyces lunaelactis TaxID=1535768 RepID=UPI0015853CD9|nr:type II secretion system F family protein [Streptomyces lunaelactis]NUK04728.1 type II secretion system F family protein [Streptomyces lunaelactis]NUK11318.1 type II secretion system F family protein [Streptomyces lunaelactis]NUK17722.1 type II secretion system F family protein [Streptomyces lunaelactis]NUK26353.1 type II secretion system F family protein [Streptomyces lunaelactis]NUK37771.1 type II secretion system F family protein [Streptomyces lunaelactis]